MGTGVSGGQGEAAVDDDDLARDIGRPSQGHDDLGDVFGPARAPQRGRLLHHLAHQVPVGRPGRVDQSGATAFTRTPGPTTLATSLVMWLSAALLAAYGMEDPVGRTPATEATFTIDPPASRSAGMAATDMAHVPKTLTSKIRRHTSTVAASRSWCGITAVVPALFTSVSRRPQRSSAAATSRPGVSGSVRSPRT